MATFFRIVQTAWADDAMSGEGARIHGGRWNPPGMPAVYLAESRALAALEIMVHAPREMLKLDWSIFRVEVPDACIADLGEPPVGWRNEPVSDPARARGAAWLQAGESVALRLPSVIIPQEHALMLNPRHRQANAIVVSDAEPFGFDPRLAG